MIFSAAENPEHKGKTVRKRRRHISVVFDTAELTRRTSRYSKDAVIDKPAEKYTDPEARKQVSSGSADGFTIDIRLLRMSTMRLRRAWKARNSLSDHSAGTTLKRAADKT